MIKRYKIDTDAEGWFDYAAFREAWSFMGFTWWTRIHRSDSIERLEKFIEEHTKLPIYIEYP